MKVHFLFSTGNTLLRNWKSLFEIDFAHNSPNTNSRYVQPQTLFGILNVFQTPPQTCLILTMYCCYKSRTTIRQFIVVTGNQCFQLSQLNHVLPKVAALFFLRITNRITEGRLLSHTIKKILNQYLSIHIFHLTSVIFTLLFKTSTCFLPF